MSGPATAIVWFRRDLRLTDNPALAAACANAERVVALYVHAPDEEGEWAPGAASRWWLHHSLARLGAGLRERGGALCLRRGPTLDALLRVAHETGAERVYWNRLYDPAIVARDTRIKVSLREAGLEAGSFNAALLVEPWETRTSQGDPYRVFTPFWRSCVPLLDTRPQPLPPPECIPAPQASTPGLALDDLALLPSIRWDRGLAAAWVPGERGALDRLEAFCGGAMAGYADGRNRPDQANTSRLSPYLHFGEVGPRQCLAAVRNALVERPGAQSAAEAFVRQIGWREFAHHLLHHFPHTATQPLDARFERFPWEPRDDLFEAWQRGRTGYPLADAGMRELWTTGWMHNRVRMLVASLLTKNLRQPWLAGARWFWDTLVDADLANNTLGWQWTAGCGADASPFFRIFNPALQAERHDPDQAYVHRWVPELAGDGDGRASYPAPVVDFRESRTAALAAFGALKG